MTVINEKEGLLNEEERLLSGNVEGEDGLWGTEVIHKGTSAWQTAMNLFRGTLGSGILGLPFGFLQGGLWAGVIGMPIICVASLHCSKLLVDCKRKLQKQDPKNYSYGEIGEICLGSWGVVLVNIFVMITQMGFGCAYVIFISENMHTMVPSFSHYFWVAMCFPFLYALCMLRSLKYLAPFSSLANFTLLFGIGIVYYHSIHRITEIEDPLHGVKAFNWPTLGVFFGQAIYCYEGIGLIIPMESRMKKPQNFISVLYSVVGFESILLISFAALGYLAFGSMTQEIITNNLPSGWMTSSVRGLLCFSLLMTFPVQYYPVIEILETYLFPKHKDVSWRYTKENLLRLFLVLLGCLVAVAVGSKFGLFMGLIGSLGSSALAFIFPTIFHLKIMGSDLNLLLKAKDVGFLLFGLAGGIAGTIASVTQLVEAL